LRPQNGYAGFPAALNGLSIAKEVFEEKGLIGQKV
jgi:alkylhydroperoxidase/carboxymuconolactone decarboxylase family protein YurZ